MHEAQESMIFEAVSQSRLNTNCKVFNLDLFGPKIFIHLPNWIHDTYRLLSIYDVDSKEAIADYFYESIHELWVDISRYELNLSIGIHTYALEFINNITGDSLYLYFQYIIQNDDPDKPYVYIDRTV